MIMLRLGFAAAAFAVLSASPTIAASKTNAALDIPWVEGKNTVLHVRGRVRAWDSPFMFPTERVFKGCGGRIQSNPTFALIYKRTTDTHRIRITGTAPNPVGFVTIGEKSGDCPKPEGLSTHPSYVFTPGTSQVYRIWLVVGPDAPETDIDITIEAEDRR